MASTSPSRRRFVRAVGPGATAGPAVVDPTAGEVVARVGSAALALELLAYRRD